MDANSRQVAGDHYKNAEYQHWDFVYDAKLDYFRGQITRYISRAPRHPDGPKENYEKALHYIDKAEELFGNDTFYNIDPVIIRRFCDAQRFGWDSDLENAVAFSAMGAWKGAREFVNKLNAALGPPQSS